MSFFRYLSLILFGVLLGHFLLNHNININVTLACIVFFMFALFVINKLTSKKYSGIINFTLAFFRDISTGLALVVVFNFPQNIRSYIIFGIVLLIFLIFIISFLRYTKFNKALGYLYNECDPEKLYKAMKESKMRRGLTGIARINNISAALISMGKYNEALANLGDFESSMDRLKRETRSRVFIKNDYKVLLKLVYIINYLASYLYLKMLSEADYMYDLLLEMPAVPVYDNLIKVSKSAYFFEKGNFDEAKAIFDNVKTKFNSLYEEVHYNYLKGLLMEHFGELEEAKKSFTFVVEKGNKLYIKKEAEERLKTLTA